MHGLGETSGDLDRLGLVFQHAGPGGP
jgi:hypothetical protein